MYNTVLFLHSWVRWIVLLAGLAAIVLAWRGLLTRQVSTGGSRGVARAYVISMDVQFLLGVILYAGVSPITSAAFADFGAAMKDSILRFFAVEHLVTGLAAVALVHVGNARAKRAADERGRFKQQAIFFTISFVLLLLTVPWPGRAMGRVLFRGL